MRRAHALRSKLDESNATRGVDCRISGRVDIDDERRGTITTRALHAGPGDGRKYSFGLQPQHEMTDRIGEDKAVVVVDGDAMKARRKHERRTGGGAIPL